VVKSLPSRVGAGPLPFEVTAEQAAARGIAETGVVTNRPRRKADRIDLDLLRYSATLNGPTQIALTFIDHVDSGLKGARSAAALTREVRDLIRVVEDATGAPVTLLDTGPRLGDVIELS
jgi:adenylosuccinate synthase